MILRIHMTSTAASAVPARPAGKRVREISSDENHA
jgi:hypothetical protein